MSSPLPAFPAVDVHVSLDGSGAFDGPDDRLTPRVHHARGVEVTEGRDGARQLNGPKINSGGFDLRNEDGRANPERPDSPYYQLLEEGKPIRYRARHGERRLVRSHTLIRSHLPLRGVGVYPLGRHVIDDLGVGTGFGNRRVPVETVGHEIVLTGNPITVPLMVAPRVDQCVTAILDAVSWPSALRRIDVSDTTLLYWWCDERDPWTALLELLASEGAGTFGVDREGVFYFESRNHRAIADRSVTSRATLSDRNTGGLYFTDFQYDRGYKHIFNRATYSTRRRTPGSAGTVIWTYGTNLTLASGASRTLIARPNDGNPFQAAITPTSPTDFTVSGGTVSVSLSASSGLVAFITITATSGTPTVSNLQLRATPLTVVSETTAENTVDASASIARYSPIPGANIPRTLQVQGWPEIDLPNAEGTCDAWVLRQMWPRPQVTFTVEAADAEHLKLILQALISDRWSLVEAHTGLAADVWVNRLQLRISGHQGRTVELVVGAEKCDTLTGMVWDEDTWDAPTSLWGI